MSRKVLAVFGATGRQGTSIIDHVLGSPSLSSRYSIRALTRDTSKPDAQELSRRGVELACADVDNPHTLGPALVGAHTVVAITITNHGSNTYDREVADGKAMADAAVAAGAEYLVFSTLPSALAISGGKYKVAAFDAKANIEKCMRSLPIKSAFYAPGIFMEALKPQKNDRGQYVLANFNASTVELALIATKRDVGKFVGPILAHPEEYEGKVVIAAVQNASWSEVARVMSKVSGKEVVYEQVSLDVFAGLLPEGKKSVNYTNMFKLFEDFSYYGHDYEVPAELKGEVADLETFLMESKFALE